jgi:hypothetical protein
MALKIDKFCLKKTLNPKEAAKLFRFKIFTDIRLKKGLNLFLCCVIGYCCQEEAHYEHF